jgi:predicted HD phosphohydrolase
MNTVLFTQLADASPEDVALMEKDHLRDRALIADQVLSLLRSLDVGIPPFPVTHLAHMLQTATLAHAAGADEETVCVALIHDVGDKLAPDTHGELAAAIARPYVSPEHHWLLVHHPLFQGYHYYDRLGRDRNERERYRGHPAFEITCRFCDDWDQKAFDPRARPMPLAAFEPMLRRLFAKPPRF